MSKIVVLAKDEEKDAVKAAFEAAGLECEVVEPTAKNVLHLAIGLVDDADDEDSNSEEAAENDAVDAGAESSTEEVPVEDDSAPAEEIKEESLKLLGKIIVDGEAVEAFESTSGVSSLHVQNLVRGPKTTYRINESGYGWWPADVSKPMMRVRIETTRHATSIELPIYETTSKAFLLVGSDLREMFE